MAGVVVYFPGVGTLEVAAEDVLPTAGAARRGDEPRLSLCMLFQRGSCRMAAQCNQAHVPPAAAQAARMLHRTCCYACGNVARCPPELLRRARAGDALCLLRGSSRAANVPFARVVWTAHWAAFPLESRARVERSTQAVCRLHRRGACNRGAECLNVHVCRLLLLEDDPTVDAVHEAWLKNKALLDGGPS